MLLVKATIHGVEDIIYRFVLLFAVKEVELISINEESDVKFFGQVELRAESRFICFEETVSSL